MRKWLLIGPLATAALVAPSTTTARTSGDTPPGPTARTTTYGAAFFAPSAPQTALDIARRVPGFTLELGDPEIRGFAAAAGNVVINGARPSRKSESLTTTLSRIPASQVIRVEVAPGELYGAEYLGKSEVLNFVLSRKPGLSGNINISAWRIYTGRILPNTSGTVAVSRGESNINISGGTGRDDYVEEGTDTLTDLFDGSPVEFRRKVNRYHQHDPYVSASWALESARDRSFHLEARYSADRSSLMQSNKVRSPIGLLRRDRLTQDLRNPVKELGGDVTRPFAGGAVKFLALATRRSRDYTEVYDFGGQSSGDLMQLQEAQRNETLGRLTWSHAALGGLSVEFGGEVVLNSLDNHLELFDAGPAGERVRIELPIDDAKVREKRGELFVSLGSSLSNRLRFDAGMAIEVSRLDVRGDARAHRSLHFWKPTIALDWKAPGSWHALASVRRTVAQLDFFDFVAAAELLNGRVSAGNENLQPQRAWEFRTTIQHSLLATGLGKLELGLDQISKLQDRILTASGFDAPGNIGSGRRVFAALTLDLPLDSFGVAGGRLKLTGQLQRTRVEDPVTARRRDFSGEFPHWKWRAEFRRDVGRWSFCFTAEDRDRYTFVRTNELDTSWFGSVYGAASMEYKPSERTKVAVEIDNLFNTTYLRHRVLFSPDRASPISVNDERRVRNWHPSVGVTLKQSFGSATLGPKK